LNPSPGKIAICIPVFNDWTSVNRLIQEIAHQPIAKSNELTVLLVDDGSTEQPDRSSLAAASAGKLVVEILELNRNVGHQRAIAIGLSCLADQSKHDAVVVMDADGEDNPADIATLIDEMQRHDPAPVVFARRSRRTEGVVFRGGYLAFRILHRLLTGCGCNIGNFSIIPAQWLDRVVHAPELWKHYAASVIASRLPVSKVPCSRHERYAGKSHMNLTSLVVHGLRAISVFGETVGVRICLALGMMIVFGLAGLGAVLYIKAATSMAIPGWATTATGLTLVLLINVLVLTAPALLLILSARSHVGFMPARDWEQLVARHKDISEH
jgi:hypothetical protein